MWINDPPLGMKTTLPPSPSFACSKMVVPCLMIHQSSQFPQPSFETPLRYPDKFNMTFFTSPTISRSSSFSPSNHRATGIGSPANQVLRSPTNRKKSNQAKFAAVGGFIFGASASTAIILTIQTMNHEEEPSPRRSTDAYIPSISLDPPQDNNVNEVASRSSEVWFATESASIVPTTAPRLEGLKAIVESVPTLAAAHNESNEENDGIPTFLPSGVLPTELPTQGEDVVPPSTSVPTFSPTGLLPTDLPTQGLYDSNIKLTALPIQKRSSEVGFRLRLYWEEGYFWQERSTETWWCMSCADNYQCKRNSKLKINNCKVASNRDTRFVVKRINRNYQFRVTNTKLCLQKMRGRSLRLKPCSKNKLQQFKDYSLTEKFDLRPVRYSSRCLSQHHHPKQDEEVYAETCAKAHRHDTGYWIAY